MMRLHLFLPKVSWCIFSRSSLWFFCNSCDNVYLVLRSRWENLEVSRSI